MFAQERLHAIETIVRQKGRLTVGELASQFDASEITIRRDLRLLEAEGKVVRAHGGALHPDFLQPEPGFERKAVDGIEAKAAIARTVAASLPEHGQVFIDAGTTCLEVGRQLLERRELTIITNSIPLLQLGGDAKARVVALGGEVRPLSLALVGALALDWLQALRFDVAVIGASGLDRTDGASTTELSEAAVKQQVCARARRRILAAHAAKWNQPAAVCIAPWSRFNHFVTDARLTAADKAHLRQAGVTLQTVSLS
jgi:DeoR/GlpR family transcriptional regulator of sugar metabolism